MRNFCVEFILSSHFCGPKHWQYVALDALPSEKKTMGLTESLDCCDGCEIYEESAFQILFIFFNFHLIVNKQRSQLPPFCDLLETRVQLPQSIDPFMYILALL
jgi:hypothetical protein